MPDTPEARAAQALELADVLDIHGMPFQRSAVADLLRAVAADVQHLKEAYDVAADREFYAQQNLTQEQIRSHSARTKLAAAVKALEAVESLIGDSYGVAGLHLNDDVAPWSELRQGGAFEGWLGDFDAALDVVRDGNCPEIPVSSPAEQPIRDLVSRFAAALLEKMIAAEAKHGWRNGWLRNDWADKCRSDMRHHIEKGDPRDVAAYCAFMWHHGWSTAEEIAWNANCPGDPVPCHRCKGTGTVPRGPQICTTCDHGTTGICAKNHGPATAYKGCSDWDARTGEADDPPAFLRRHQPVVSTSPAQVTTWRPEPVSPPRRA